MIRQKFNGVAACWAVWGEESSKAQTTRLAGPQLRRNSKNISERRTLEKQPGKSCAIIRAREMFWRDRTCGERIGFQGC